MYIPNQFIEDRSEVLRELLARHSFAILVTMGPGGLTASHIPMKFDPHPAPNGSLWGHVARANPQAAAAPDAQALAIFSGPHAYVSPSWYASKAEAGRVVPTWNYVAVHAYGTPRFFTDADRLRDLVRRLTDRHERALAEPWAVDDAPKEFIDRQLAGITGFEMPVERLEGKWKMSQNRSPADRARVAAGLGKSGDSGGLAVAALIAEMDR